ncbi:hypothetical protein BKD09_42460 [Bradyrhizobium japonicum]|uniref:Uncharacterized protein n=1 Tax=Bradyrhizobium japonicum TaxID=375 RepID=A0A1L3FNX9_BRAJP|nr:hypothetical protein BKD09_42460 [Bradyrhizobium japonicum]
MFRASIRPVSIGFRVTTSVMCESEAPYDTHCRRHSSLKSEWRAGQKQTLAESFEPVRPRRAWLGETNVEAAEWCK